MPFTIPFFDAAKDEWHSEGGNKIAWRATANALRDFTKDMYTGEIIIMGDPIIKPYDLLTIADVYEDINGTVEVETVTHSFNIETGFTTGIVPDCISAIDNTYTSRIMNVVHASVGPVVASFLTYAATNMVFKNTTRSLMLGAMSKINTGASAVTSVVQQLGKIMGQEQMSQFGGMIGDDGINIMANSVGLTGIDFKVNRAIQGMSNTYLQLMDEVKIKSGKDVGKFFSSYLDDGLVAASGGADELIAGIDEALKTASSKDVAKLNVAKEKALKIKAAQLDITDMVNKTKLNRVDVTDFADEMLRKIPTLDAGVDKAELNKIANALKSGTGDFIEGADDVQEAMKNIGKLAEHVDDVKVGSLNKIVKGVQTNKSEISKVAKVLKDVDIDFKDVNMLRKGRIGLLANSLKMGIGLLAQIVIAKTAREFFERKLRNLQVLTVFPVFKEGMVMTSGLNGSKGLVIGSPTWNERGFMDSLAEWFIEDSFFSGIMNFMIGTHEMKEILQKFKRDNGFIGSDIAGKKDVINQLLSNVAAKETDKVRPFIALFVELRTLPSKDDLEVAGATYAIQNVLDIQNYNMSNSGLSYLFDNETLKLARDKKYLKMNYGNNAKDIIIRDTSRADGGNNVRSKVTKSADKTVWDIPYLRADSIVLLSEIVNRYSIRVQPDFKKEGCKYDKLVDNTIFINNATKVNDNGWNSTGFSFSIQVKTSKELGNILSEISVDQDKILEKIDNKTNKVFTYKPLKGVTNGYKVYVYPRKG